MKNESRQGLRIPLLISCIFVVSTTLPGFVAAQSQEMKERVAEVKEAVARNKQALAQYTWVEQVAISLKGEQKKQEHFQVRLGPDGKPLKQSPAPPPAPPEHEGRLKKRIVEKKKEEYKEYADQIRELIRQYVPPERDMLEQAYQKGDNMTLLVDKTQKELLSLSIATYLDDPKDAVNVTVAFARIPGGPNHVSGETINGVSKQLTVAVQNSNYQHF